METRSLVLPLDESNTKLVDNVHPPDWKNPEPASRYNLVVIGAGTAGLVMAAGAAGLGARVALIERHLMGGDCLNVGCVPSKAIIRAGRAAADARKAAGFGISTGPLSIDFGKAMERMRGIRAGISSHDSARRFSKELGVDVFIGSGAFIGRDTVEVGGKQLRFRKAAICTGARAAAPPIPGIDEAGYLTNENVFWLTELPERLAVIGGGPIGCELSQTFARLGSSVTLVETMSHILSREDPDAAAIVQQALVRDGVELRLNAKIVRVERATGRDRVITLEQAGQRTELRADEILVGIGRAPNVDGLGLDRAGIAYDKRLGITVDDHLRTTNSNVYAAGDICFPFKFTHTADALARIVIANALFKARQRASSLVVPWCTYTDPEIAHVGMYETEAREKGIGVLTLTVPFSDVDRALLDGEADGLARVHLQRGSDRILGATIVARHAGEMLNELTLAMTAGLGLSSIGKTIHPYPTQAEAIKKLADQYARTRLTPLVKKLFARWLQWQRS